MIPLLLSKEISRIDHEGASSVAVRSASVAGGIIPFLSSNLKMFQSLVKNGHCANAVIRNCWCNCAFLPFVLLYVSA
jgi:hypothetical protein